MVSRDKVPLDLQSLDIDVLDGSDVDEVDVGVKAAIFVDQNQPDGVTAGSKNLRP